MIRKGLLAHLGRLLFFLGKIWERNQLPRPLFRPACTEKLSEFVSGCTLILRESVRVAFGHPVPAVTKSLLTDLLWDSQRVHRGRIRVAERVQPQRGRPLFATSCLFDGSVLTDNLGEELRVNLWYFQTAE